MKYRYILATSLFMCFTTPTLAYKNTSVDRLNKACGEKLCLNQDKPRLTSLGGSDLGKPNEETSIPNLTASLCILGFCLGQDSTNPTKQGQGDGGRPPKEQSISNG